MKGETGERWRALCQQSEQDSDKFMAQAREITRLSGGKRAATPTTRKAEE